MLLFMDVETCTRVLREYSNPQIVLNLIRGCRGTGAVILIIVALHVIQFFRQ